MEKEFIIEKLKSALDNYNSYNEEKLNQVILYMRQAERVLKRDKNSENSHKKLECLVLACKRKIVENNIGLVKKKARFYREVTGKGCYYDDFVSEGITGILRAIPKYNPSIGKFSNYIAIAINQNIKRRLGEILRDIRLPINFQFYTTEIEYFSKLFKKKYNRNPSRKELAEFSGKTLKRVKELERMKNLSQSCSLDVEINDQSDGKSLLDYLVDYRNPSVEEENIKGILYQELVNCIKKLPDKRQTKVLLGRLEGKTFEEIALEMNKTRARIEQIEKKAITKVEGMERFKRLKAD